MFPYNHQTIKFCPNCYNGVIELCEYCWKPLPRNTSKWDCEQYKAREKEKNRIKDDYFSDVNYFVDAYKDSDEYESDEEMMNNLPEVLWLTDPVGISMDADQIIENVCEELHEDAEV